MFENSSLASRRHRMVGSGELEEDDLTANSLDFAFQQMEYWNRLFSQDKEYNCGGEDEEPCLFKKRFSQTPCCFPYSVMGSLYLRLF